MVTTSPTIEAMLNLVLPGLDEFLDELAAVSDSGARFKGSVERFDLVSADDTSWGALIKRWRRETFRRDDRERMTNECVPPSQFPSAVAWAQAFDDGAPQPGALEARAARGNEALLKAMGPHGRELHRPELAAQLIAQSKLAVEGVRQVNVIATFTPGADAPASSFLPASLTASIRSSSEMPLSAMVAELVRHHGGKPLYDDERSVRFEREQSQFEGGESCTATTIGYLTPIPGTRQQRALHLTAMIMRPSDVPSDDEPMRLMCELFDRCVSTLRWHQPSGAAHSHA